MNRGADRPQQAATEVHAAARGPRIAIVAPGEIFGGAERQILTLMRALQPSGCAIQLLLFHDGELARRARAAGIATGVLGASGLLDFASLRRLRSALTEFDAEVVHLHGYRAAVYCALIGAGRFGAVKTEHGSLEVPAERLLERLKLDIYRRLEMWATRRLRARVVYVTEDLRRASAAATHASVIHNGIESLDRGQTRRPPEYTPGYVNIAIVGRLEAIKGIDHALRALAAPHMPPDVRLHIVGSGPLLGELQALARDLGIAERVGFLGFRDNVYDYVAHAHALLMPSLHEGLPYTVLEAMALQTPILASRVGGLAEVLVDGETALLFEPASATAIAAAVARLCQNSTLPHSLTMHALAECRRRFSGDAMAESYLALFEALRRPR